MVMPGREKGQEWFGSKCGFREASCSNKETTKCVMAQTLHVLPFCSGQQAKALRLRMVSTRRGQWGTLLHAATQGPRLTEALSASVWALTARPQRRERLENHTHC